MYYFKSSYLTGNSVSLLETVAENSQHYTKRQVECAKKARALHQALETPLIRDLKAFILMNCIANNPVTVTDVNVAEKILVLTLDKSKERQQGTNHHQLFAKLINNHADVDLCMDTL